MHCWQDQRHCIFKSTDPYCNSVFTHVHVLQGNAVKVAKRLQNKPRHPVQLAADIVEKAIVTDGDQYLQTRQRSMSWWQLSLLDVKAFLLSVAVVGVSLLVLTFRYVWIRVAKIAKYAESAHSKQKHS